MFALVSQAQWPLEKLMPEWPLEELLPQSPLEQLWPPTGPLDERLKLHWSSYFCVGFLMPPLSSGPPVKRQQLAPTELLEELFLGQPL